MAKIIKSSKYALKLIKNIKSGVVHSISSKSIYILLKNKVICIQAKNTEIGPISLVSDLLNFNEIKIQKGNICTIKNNSITISNQNNKVQFVLKSNIFIFDTILNTSIDCRASSIELKNSLLFSKKIIELSYSSGLGQILNGSLTYNTWIINYLKSKLLDTEAYFTKKKFLEATSLLSELVGVGTGLTPNCDDFIVGFLAANSFFGYLDKNISIHFEKSIKNNLDKTNRISAEFLSLALSNNYNLAIIEYFYTLDNYNSKNIVIDDKKLSYISNKFFNIGSSSGIDSLFGIYSYCKWILN